MEKMKFYTQKEIENEFIGKKDPQKRDKDEECFEMFLISEVIQQVRQVQNPT